MRKTLILLIVLSGCGQESLESMLPPKKIESRFIPDFNDFIEISKEYGFNPSFNDIRYMQTNDSIYSESAVGMCYSDVTLKREYYSPEHREDEYIYNQIEIVSQKILSDIEVDLKEIVYHELLHCIFKLDHDELDSEDIMFPYVGQSEKSADERLRNKFQEILDEKEKGRD
jgi:hypothetical protein